MAALLEVFYDPGRAFEQVRERRLFWPALIVLSLLGLGLWVVSINKIGMENIVRHQLEQSSAQLTPEQMQQRLSVANAPWYRNMMYCIGLLAPPIVAIVMAAVLLVAFLMVGRKIKFSQMLGAVSYSMVPFSVLGILASTILLMIVADPETRDPQNLLAFNVGAFMDRASTNKALYALAGSLDLLVFGQILLMSYGISKVTGAKWSQSLVIVAGLWVLFVVGKVAIAAIRG